MKVLLVGHACGPGRGSEPGLTWNWGWHLSELHEVWVLTHPQYREEIERYLDEHPNPNLRFVWVKPPAILDPWNPARGERGIKLHYILWQWAALRRARQLHRTHNLDVVHHVSWGTVSVPPPLWRLPVPFIWGPIGGGMVSPRAFRHYFGEARTKELLRSLRLQILPHLPSLRRAVRRCAILFATNRETATVLKEAGASQVLSYFDNGLPENSIPDPMPVRPPGRKLTLLWAGRLEPRKALGLGLEALAQVKSEIPVQLLVAGDGPLRQEWEELARQLQLTEQVQFLGAVPFAEMQEIFHRADALLFTSLRDSFGSVALEAMAQALPVLTLDHQGVGELVPHEAGIKIPVTTPEETISALANGIRYLAEKPGARQQMGENGWHFARKNTWPYRAKEMSRWYEECVTEYAKRKAASF